MYKSKLEVGHVETLPLKWEVVCLRNFELLFLAVFEHFFSRFGPMCGEEPPPKCLSMRVSDYLAARNYLFKVRIFTFDASVSLSVHPSLGASRGAAISSVGLGPEISNS